MCCKDNRVVTIYPKDKLYLLGCRDNISYELVNYQYLEEIQNQVLSRFLTY